MQEIESLRMLEEGCSTPVSGRAVCKQIDRINDLCRQSQYCSVARGREFDAEACNAADEKHLNRTIY